MFYTQSDCSIYHGNCLNVLNTLTQKATAVVCDPPYGIGFTNMKWDDAVPSTDYWHAILDACLPGAPLLAFGGICTHHRLMCALEEAGWELRDCMMWLHSQGFPKGCNISKQLSIIRPIQPEQILKATNWLRETAKRLKVTPQDINLAVGKVDMSRHWLTKQSQPSLPSLKDWEKLEPLLGTPPDWFKNLLHLKETGRPSSDMEIVGEGNANFTFFKDVPRQAYPLTAPTNSNAKLWHGWHTALKPAWEPIVLAQKPMPKSYADNAKAYGVAGINVTATRLGKRWPSNVLQDGSVEVTEALGHASRFFYCPKAHGKDRGEGNPHPTVKPQRLMEYLIKLVTMPENNLILDPFMGSGSTLLACKTLGLPCIGIELEESYCTIAARRLDAHLSEQEIQA